jgi:phosphate-selective porin OprO/OprP
MGNLLKGVMVLLIGMTPLAVSGGEQSPPPTKEAVQGDDLQGRLDRLQSLVEQQQQTIQDLEGRLTVANTSDASAARVEEIKKVVREVMADAEFRESLYPDVMQVGYDHGFYIKSSDEAFLLNIQGLLQVRYIGTERQNDNPRRQGRNPQDDINGFEISRLFLTFAGRIHTEKLTYQITVAGDTNRGYEIGLGNEWTTYYAFVNYEVIPEFQVMAGLMDVPQGRQMMTWDSHLQFIDRSMVEEAFALYQSVGAMLHGTLAKRLTYMAGVFNGFYDSWDSPSRDELDTNFAYAARLIGHILGNGINDETDLAYSKDPLMDIAASFYYNDDNGDRHGPPLFYNVPEHIRSGRGIGGFANPNNLNFGDSGTEYYGFGVDWAFRYRGFSVTAEWYLRTVESDSSYSPWELLSLRDGPSHFQGGYIQAGYFIIPKRVEVAARMGGIWDNASDNTWEYSFGVNYYPWGSHNFKIQADFTHIDESAVSSPWVGINQDDEINMFRVQLQAAFE